MLHEDFQILKDFAKDRKKRLRKEKNKNNKEEVSLARAKKYNASKRREKYEEKKRSRDILRERCKSCNKVFHDSAILKHISHKESCRRDYTDEEIAEFIMIKMYFCVF